MKLGSDGIRSRAAKPTSAGLLAGSAQAGVLAWIIMFMAILAWSARDLATVELGNRDNLSRIGLVVLAACLALGAIARNVTSSTRSIAGPLAWLLIYGCVAAISSLYLEEGSLYSLWKSLELIVDVLVAVVLTGYAAREEAMASKPLNVIVCLFSLMLFAFWVEVALLPSQALLPSRGTIPFTMRGVSPVYNGNTLGFLCAVVALTMLASLFRKTTSRSWRYVTLVLALLGLILAQSRTSLIGFIVGTALYLFLDRRRRILVVLLIIAIPALLLTTFAEIAGSYLLRGQSEELLTSFSGRTEGWSVAWEMFKEKPVAGYGFAAAARLAILGVGGASTLHGAMFDVLVGVGLIGAIPWLAAIVLVGWRMFRPYFNDTLTHAPAERRSLHAEMAALYVLTMIRSATSSGLAMHDHTFMVFLALSIYTAIAFQAPKKRGARPTANFL